MERRDFFGILAAPLLRRFLPPEPVCGGFIPPNLPAVINPPCYVVPPNYSGKFTFCFSALVNDDLAALSDLPRQMAIEERKRNELLISNLFDKGRE